MSNQDQPMDETLRQLLINMGVGIDSKNNTEEASEAPVEEPEQLSLLEHDDADNPSPSEQREALIENTAYCGQGLDLAEGPSDQDLVIPVPDVIEPQRFRYIGPVATWVLWANICDAIMKSRVSGVSTQFELPVEPADVERAGYFVAARIGSTLFHTERKLWAVRDHNRLFIEHCSPDSPATDSYAELIHQGEHIIWIYEDHVQIDWPNPIGYIHNLHVFQRFA